MTPSLPEPFERCLPAACRQVVLVCALSRQASSGTLSLLGKSAGGWELQKPVIPVSLGRNGLAWGRGDHAATPAAGYPMKVEGDGCSPAGVFAIPKAFGYAAAAPTLRLPYLPLTLSLIAVDDPQSRHYNQIVDSAQVACDWCSREMMLREDGLYEYGAVIAHNSDNEPGAGSCIFLHLWRSPGHPTAGCTAMAKDDLLTVLEWLDADCEPRLVQYAAGSVESPAAHPSLI